MSGIATVGLVEANWPVNHSRESLRQAKAATKVDDQGLRSTDGRSTVYLG